MSFFTQREIELCKCSAVKDAYWKYTFNETFSKVQKHKDSIPIFNKPRKVDVLILLEKKELDLIHTFIPFVEKQLKGISYEIILSVNCISKNAMTKDVLQPSLDCKKYHVKNLIHQYNPSVIITSGRAIYTITENKKLKPHHFYSLHEDDTYFYSNEFHAFVFPIPFLFEFLNGNRVENDRLKYTVKDLYETHFTKLQLQRAIKFIDKNKFRIPKLNYIEVDNPNQFLRELIDNKNITDLAIDTEATGLLFYKDKIHSIQVSYDGKTGYFLFFDKINRRLLIELFNRKDICISIQNSSFDIKMFIAHGIRNARCDFDTMLAAHAINENSPSGLKILTWLYTYYGGYENELNKYIKSENISDFSLVPKKILVKYGCYDPILTLQLKWYLTKRLDEEDEDVRNNFYNIIMPAVPMIVYVEMNGIGFDMKYAVQYTNSLKQKAKEIEEKVYTIAGSTFNLGSNQQVTNVFKKLNIPPITDKKGRPLLTKSNDYILNKDTIPEYAKKYKIAEYLLEYNHLMKEISQIGIQDKSEIHYLFKSEDEEDKGLIEYVYNGRLYGNYGLHGTATSRLASFSPNLQNFTKTEEFRRLFIHSLNYIFGEKDYWNMEVVLYSQYSGSGELEKALLNGTDLHCLTGNNVRNLLLSTNMSYDEFYQKSKVEEISEFKKYRQFGKVTNFQMLYGVTKYGLARALGISPDEAEKVMEAYYKTFPEVKEYMDRMVEFGKKHGYVKSLLGWKRNLPFMTYIGKDSENDKNYKNARNSCFNSPVQSLSGQTTIIAMTGMWKEFIEKNLKSKIIANVHDSDLDEIFISEIDIVVDISKRHMKKRYYENPNIPGRGPSKIYNDIDINIGSIWGFGMKLEKWKKENVNGHI